VEARALMRLVVPICVQMGSQQLMVTTDLIFLGRLGRFPLAVGTLASTLFNLLWFGIAGFGTAFDTLGSQAHGAGDALAVRNWAALAAASLSACCVPAAAVLLCGKFLASWVLSQDAATADAVGTFCAVLLLGLWPAALTLVLQKYLQVRNVVVPVAATSLITFGINVGANWFFIKTCGLGTAGSALATTASRFVNLALLFEYVRRTPKEYEALLDPDRRGGSSIARHTSRVDSEDTLGALTERLSFEEAPAAFADDVDTTRAPERRQNTRRGSGASSFAAACWDARAGVDARMVAEMTKLGWRGAVMVAAEASSFDVTVVFASQLSQVALDAHMAMMNVCALTFMTGPMAFGIAANVRVGNLLGSGDAARAKLAAAVAVAIGVTWMAACAIAIVAGGDTVGEVFVGTGDREVVATVARIAPYAAVFQVADGVLGTANGVLRAAGKQSELAVVNVVALWGGGVTVGALCTFALGAGVVGLWIGLALGVSGGAVWLGRAQALMDWQAEARAARANAALGGGHAREGDGDGDDERAALVAVAGGDGDEDVSDGDRASGSS
jgi:Na+-driven multidrug efflux pump